MRLIMFCRCICAACFCTSSNKRCISVVSPGPIWLPVPSPFGVLLFISSRPLVKITSELCSHSQGMVNATSITQLCTRYNSIHQGINWLYRPIRDHLAYWLYYPLDDALPLRHQKSNRPSIVWYYWFAWISSRKRNQASDLV